MAAKWLELTGRLVLIDEETRLVIGQIFKSDRGWTAYDNDPAKHTGAGALSLGEFFQLALAKDAVEKLLK